MNTTSNTNSSSSRSPNPSCPSSGVAKYQIELVFRSNWCEFWSEVAQSSGMTSTPTSPRLISDVQDGAVHYFREAIRKKEESSQKLSETAFQKTCLGYLTVLGNEVSLENTSDGVKDFSVITTVKDENIFPADEEADRFRKLAFVRSSEQSHRPDITIRPRMEGDCEILAVRADLPKLSQFRIMPWATIGYVELKRPTESLTKHVGQAVDYCENLLRISPDRKVVFCALTNLKDLIFVAAYNKPSLHESIFVKSKAIDTDIVAALSEFIATDSAQLGFIRPVYESITRLIPQKALGRGSTAAAMEIRESRVLKVSKDIEALQIEAIMTQKIFCSRTTSNEVMIPSCDWDGSWQSIQNLLFAPVVGDLTLDHLRSLWAILKVAHAAGVVHRDLRRPNLGEVNGRLGLMDWSSSWCYTAELAHLPTRPGGRSTASIRVLKQMDSSRNRGDYACYPNDEVISIIYLALQSISLFKDYDAIHHHPPSWESAERNWNSVLNELDRHLLQHQKGKILSGISLLSDDNELNEDIREEILFECLELIFSVQN